MLLDKLKIGKKTKSVKRIIPISWGKLIPGVIVLVLGLYMGSFYIKDPSGMLLFGILGAIFISTGGFLAYEGISRENSGFALNVSKKKMTGRENAVILFARRDKKSNKDVPLIIRFVELTHIPIGARLHYFRNFKKHFYELYNNTETKKLEPVVMPDKIHFPPELFQIPAAMQVYKEAIEYLPPTLMQKLAPGLMILVIGVVGILMTMTTTGGR